MSAERENIESFQSFVIGREPISGIDRSCRYWTSAVAVGCRSPGTVLESVLSLHGSWSVDFKDGKGRQKSLKMQRPDIAGNTRVLRVDVGLALTVPKLTVFFAQIGAGLNSAPAR